MLKDVRAREVFERAVRHANDVGSLLAEEVDSATGEFLGTFPQAFSHIGLVDAARYRLGGPWCRSARTTGLAHA